jgi:hypothetical protein
MRHLSNLEPATYLNVYINFAASVVRQFIKVLLQSVIQHTARSTRIPTCCKEKYVYRYSSTVVPVFLPVPVVVAPDRYESTTTVVPVVRTFARVATNYEFIMISNEKALHKLIVYVLPFEHYQGSGLGIIYTHI